MELEVNVETKIDLNVSKHIALIDHSILNFDTRV